MCELARNSVPRSPFLVKRSPLFPLRGIEGLREARVEGIRGTALRAVRPKGGCRGVFWGGKT